MSEREPDMTYAEGDDSLIGEKGFVHDEEYREGVGGLHKNVPGGRELIGEAVNLASPDSVELVLAKMESLDYQKKVRVLNWLYDSFGESKYGMHVNEIKDNVGAILTRCADDVNSSFMLVARARKMLDDITCNVYENPVLDGNKPSPEVVQLARYDRAEVDDLTAYADAEDAKLMKSPFGERMVKETLFYYVNKWLPDGSFVESDELNLFDTLTPHERFYLMKFLQKRKIEGIEQVRHFFHTTGSVGIKALLVSEYDTSVMGDLIQISGAIPENADHMENETGWNLVDMMGLFDIVIDNAEMIARKIDEHSDKGQTMELPDYEIWRLSDQIFEATMRKAADLLKLYVQIQKGDIPESEVSIADVKMASKQYVKGIYILNMFFDEIATEKYEELEGKKGQEPKFKVTTISGEEYVVKWFVRPRADKDGQARINFEIDFDTECADAESKEFFRQETLRLKDQTVKKESVFRMAIDRDTTDPANPRVSLDIGRAAYDGTTFRRTGDKLGNIFARASSEANHTPYSFDPYFAEEDVFAQIATRLQNAVTDRYATFRSTDYSDFLTTEERLAQYVESPHQDEQV